jgi:proteasome accessory factor C
MPKTKKLHGTDRYNFMISLTSYLIRNRRKTLEEVAKHFGVTESELKSALETISVSGVGGYRPDELFFVDYDLLDEGIVDISFAPTLDSAPRLSTRQAAAIASGLSYLESIVEQEELSEVRELRELLASGKSEALPIHVWASSANPTLDAIRRAIEQRKVISFDYRSQGGDISSRQVEPGNLISRDANWYLRGFCLSKKEIRVFRIDRMRNPIQLDSDVLDQNGQYGADTAIYQPGQDDTLVRFEVEAEAFGFLADFSPEFEPKSFETVTVDVPIGNLGLLGKLIAKYAGKVRVLAPEPARIAVREYARQALSSIRKQDEE